MNPKRSTLLAAAGIALASVWLGGQGTPAPARYKSWLEDEVRPIITDREREAFGRLETNRDRDLFIEEFWRQRDPTPGTPANERREEHGRRVVFADQRFGRGARGPGSKTDRGRVVIALGLPLKVETIDRPEVHPGEVWTYSSRVLPGRTAEAKLLFVKQGKTFALYDPGRDTPRSLVKKPARLEGLALSPEGGGETPPASWSPEDVRSWLFLKRYVSADAAAAVVPASSDLLVRVLENPRRSIREDYALEFLAGRPGPEVSYSLHPLGGASTVGVFLEPTGVFLAHCAFRLETFNVEAVGEKFLAAFRMTYRLADSRGRTLYAETKPYALELGKEELDALAQKSPVLYGSVPAIPGTHRLRVLVENTVSKEFASAEHEVRVPASGEFGISSPLLAVRTFKAAPVPGGPSRAFQVGALDLDPAVGGAVPEKEPAYLFFQVHEPPAVVLAAGQVEAAFIRDGKTVETVRRPLRNFGEGGNVLLDLPTDRLPAGTYAVRAAVREPGGRELAGDVAALEVGATAGRESWVAALTNPPAYDAYYAYALGIQHLNAGDLETAGKHLDKAHANEAKNVDYGIGFARYLLARREPAKARDVLLRYPESAGVLNVLGECHLALGDRDAAAKAWGRSLELSPNQEEIRKKLADFRRR